MIIWLNGSFGAGKTATAKELLPLVPDIRLFDPGTVGYMLRPNLADRAWMREDADLVLDTTALRAAEAAHLIADALRESHPATRCVEGR